MEALYAHVGLQVIAKDAYRKWAETAEGLPLFMRTWWMDAVCAGKEWDAVRHMPYLLRRRMGLRYILMPQQTQIGGYYIDRKETTDAALVAAEIDAHLMGLGLAYYYQHFPIDSPIPYELAKMGYTVRERVTYRIENMQDMDAVRRGYSENKRRQLKKASVLTCDMDMEAAAFYRFHERSLKAQGKQISYTWKFFDGLYAACAEHGAGQVVRVSDKEGNTHAAAFVVYDREACYFLIPAYDPQYGKSGAGALLVDACIRFAREHSRVFDFEGSMIPGVANHYRQFGSVARTYCSVERVYNPLFRILLKINEYR